MTRNLKSVYKLPANVFPKQPGFSEEPEQQNLMLKTRSRPHNQQVLVAVSIVHNLPDQYIFLLSNYFLESEPENVAIAMHWHGRGVGSLFEVKSFPGASYSQHHVVRDQQVVKGDVVQHRPQLQANPAEDLDFNLLIKMEWTENLGQCVILKGSLSSKKSGFRLPWQSVFAIIRPENKTPTYSKVINKRKTLSKGGIVNHMPGPLVTAQAGLF